ncbi:aspartate dehydrogenase [Thalassococcus sp. S3]|uniref:aspartate dehydrogenase n=1 Tax=Thalassococcus sp. S3 TaxID=2017482 RepID=UPI001024325E|nr:aspartate dehydrogenase [Thalassococcus sp. S3]QBF33435.1 aspartate dehydrogenase [Thalassococcus sp. S3]
MIGLIGRGAIATALIPLLRADGHDVLSLVRNEAGEDQVADLDDLLAARPALVVEAAGQDALAQVGTEVLRAGIPLIAASVGALADDGLSARLRQAAKEGGTRLHLPAGAVGGIDALAALPGNTTLSYTGTKPPRAWPAGTPDGTFFQGSAREAATRYPKNANVAATLALAGPGLDATRVTLRSDARAEGNTHAWEAKGGGVVLSMTVTSLPTEGNAATSALTVHALHRTVRNLTSEIAL